MTMTPCRFCGAPLEATLVDLGETPLANSFVTPATVKNERRFPLHVRVCGKCFLAQVDHAVPADAIFDADYAYFSSYSDTWVAHAKQYAEAMIARFDLDAGSLVIEIASNDGYLLQHFKNHGIPVLGIEPSANVADAALKKGVATEVAFFNSATAKRLAGRGIKADLMAANNVLAHVPDIRDFVAAFPIMLKPDGIVTFEFPHLLNLIERVQFDTIYHEHYSYLSLLAVERIFAATGLRAIDVEEIPTHGGSLRLYASRTDSSHRPSPAIQALRDKERAHGLDQLETYQAFAPRVGAVKAGFLRFLADAKKAGKKVAAYGAAAKGNTFLNYCTVGAADIVCVFDRSVAKQGKLLPGSHIPILAPERLSEIKPDFLVILPWNIADEVIATNAALTSWGGQFVIAVPELRIVR